MSNSICELFSLHRYLQYDRLHEMGMGHFDCWASRFGETVTALELAPEGTGYRARTRFSRFFNLPELMCFFKEVADIKTADQLNLPVPQVEYHVCSCKPTEIQKEMMQDLSARASMVHAGMVSPSQDNMLKITGDGRKLGLDPRIIDPSVPDEPGTKVNQCVSNILRIWREGDEKKLTQVVFCDISTPKKRNGAGIAGDSGSFNIYDDIKRKLIAGGMLPEQIAFMHDADTEIKKRDLFAKVNAGQVRVLIGSSALCGAGANFMKKLVALHDLDCPWRPRDLTQRKGRIERQGNENKTVHVYRYVTEATFDAYLWQTIEAKQRFISQIITSKSPVRSCEDVDEAALSYAEIKAICAGDLRIRELMTLDVEVNRLRMMKSDYLRKQAQLEKKLRVTFPEQIAQEQETIRNLTADIVMLSENPVPPEGFSGMEIMGQIYADREQAGAALLKAITENAGTVPTKIGSYRGFAIFTYTDAFWNRPVLRLEGQAMYQIDAGTDARGNLTRVDNELTRLPNRLKAANRQLGNLRKQRRAAKVEIGKEFPCEKELSEKAARMALLSLQLDLESKEKGAPGQDSGQQGREKPHRVWSWKPARSAAEKTAARRKRVR